MAQLGNENPANDVGDGPNEMGDYLPEVSLGSGVVASQMECGMYHTCVLEASSNQIKCWGENEYGKLGIGDEENRGNNVNEMGDYLPFLDLGTGSTIYDFNAGDSTSVFFYFSKFIFSQIFHSILVCYPQ